MDQKQYIGEQIKRFRTEAGMSAEQLGKKLDPARSSSTITSWERGRTQPDGDTLIDLCIIFGIDISEFFYKSTEYEYAVVGFDDGSCDESGYIDVPIYGEIAAGTPQKSQPRQPSSARDARAKHPMLVYRFAIRISP